LRVAWTRWTSRLTMDRRARRRDLG
jgi:hypothetical protein